MITHTHTKQTQANTKYSAKRIILMYGGNPRLSYFILFWVTLYFTVYLLD